jgi:hypothetical protein
MVSTFARNYGVGTPGEVTIVHAAYNNIYINVQAVDPTACQPRQKTIFDCHHSLARNGHGVPDLSFLQLGHNILHMGLEVADILRDMRKDDYHMANLDTNLVCRSPFLLGKRLVENARLRSTLEAEGTIVGLERSKTSKSLVTMIQSELYDRKARHSLAERTHSPQPLQSRKLSEELVEA